MAHAAPRSFQQRGVTSSTFAPCRLAADPGIVAVMARHRWSVGLLSEMPPEGKVGVSPVCVLGVNINRGQEISLRLRTDDLKGGADSSRREGSGGLGGRANGGGVQEKWGERPKEGGSQE